MAAEESKMGSMCAGTTVVQESDGVQERGDDMCAGERMTASSPRDERLSPFIGDWVSLVGDRANLLYIVEHDDGSLLYQSVDWTTFFVPTSDVPTKLYNPKVGMTVTLRPDGCLESGSIVWWPLHLVPLEQCRKSKNPTCRVDNSGVNAYCSMEGGIVYEAIVSGTLRLVRGRYLEDCWSSRKRWPRRQDVPESGLWSPLEAANLWMQYGPAFFHALSYAWLSPEHPDPDLYHSKRLAYIVNVRRATSHGALAFYKTRGSALETVSEAPPDIGMFIDFMSCPQNDRTGEDKKLFNEGLSIMDYVYGHECTTVIRCSGTPPEHLRKYDDRGWPLFEKAVTATKASAGLKVFVFDDKFDPDSCKVSGIRFLLDHVQAQDPPMSTEVFQDRLETLAERASSRPPPFNTVFTSGSDEVLVKEKYTRVWGVMSKAESLSFSSCSWSLQTVTQLSLTLPFFSNLTKFELNDVKIPDDSVLSLVGALRTEIETLWLIQMNLKDASSLSELLRRFTRLQSFRISDPSVHDEGMSNVIAALNPNLKFLCLSTTSCGDKGFTDLVDALCSRFQDLEVLKIYGNSKISTTEPLCAALRQNRLPSLQEVSAPNLDSKSDKDELCAAWADAGKDTQKLSFS